MCARLEIRAGRLWPRPRSHVMSHMYDVASRRARAVRAKCSLAGFTIRDGSNSNFKVQSISKQSDTKVGKKGETRG